MNKTLMRFLSIALLMMVSIGAWAQEKYVTVNLGANNDGKFDNGTIVEAGQEREGDAVTVTLTVTPATGYTFNKNNVTIYATLSSFSGTRTRTPEISKTLTLDGPTGDVTKATDYTVTVDANLGVWVESATFNKVSSPQKGPQMAGPDPYVGMWYITNGSNYYLVPAGGCYQDNENTPYLTTFQTAQDKNSIWRIEKVEDGDDTYYRFIHNATGKYLTANDYVLNATDYDNKGYAYLRLHLETFDTPTDATLFIIVKHTNNKLAIRSKDYYAPNIPISNTNTETADYYWLDISNGNKANYWNGDYQGALGFWYAYPINNSAAPWTFTAANQTCATPVITYNEGDGDGTFTISYPIASDDVTIHYTTDGTEPTSSSTSYSTAFSATGVKMVRAIAVKTGYDNSAEAELYSPLVPHLFKTIDAANLSYYLISPTDDNDATEARQCVTTSNVPNPRMQWILKSTGLIGGVQYYYIVNGETNKYLYCKGTTNQGDVLRVKTLGEEGTEADRFIFRLWKGDGYYFISPKIYSYETPTQNKNNMLRKQNATDHTNQIGLYQYNNDLARWQIVDVPADPRTLSSLPAEMVSDANNSVYFKFRNATKDDAGNDYFAYPPASVAYATAAVSGTAPEWYFVEATDADTWNTYYNIRNAQTGDYLYFDSETKYNNNDNKFLTSSGVTSGSEDKYKFLILKTARTQASGTYHIVPKSIRNNNNQANIALSRENKTSAKLRTSNSRDNNNACWYLDAVDFKCDVPSFQYSSGKISITTSTIGAVIYYALGTSEPAISDANRYTGPITLPEGTTAVTAIAVRNANASDKSDVATFAIQTITSGDQITNMSGFYYLDSNFTPSNTPIGTADNPFRGTIDGQLNSFSISHPMFYYVENAVIKNVILDNVTISSGITSNEDADAPYVGNTGAIACVAKGSTRIYNCGVLGSLTETKDDKGIITSIHSSSKIGGTGYVGSIVGKLDGNSRVINCYSFAEITGGSTVAGIVGFHTANKHLTQDDINTKPMVMNCMFYGDITGGTNKFPVYGGRTGDNDMIKTDNTKGVNPYNYFRADALFDNGFTNINDYKRSWPAEEEYLTRFEYYRSILNSNRHLCTYWVTGKKGTEQTAADTALIAKWVLDPSIAPYPILKKWGKYPSIINPDPSRTWRPKAKDSDGNLQDAHWVTRSSASDYEGKTLGTLSVTVKAGSHHAGSKPNSTTLTLPILDMDTLNCDYSYAKVQLPYYNEVFGDPTASASEWNDRYGGNYGVYVVTGWKVNSVDGSTTGTGEFKEAWEDGYNFADRSSTKKDIYGVSKRVFAQGGYYYVPKDVSSIEIEAYWGKAVYLRNTDNSIDRVNVTNGGSHGSAFAPAGALPSTINGQTVKTGLREAIKALDAGNTLSVYDNAVVLVGNYQKQNKNDPVGYNIDSKWHPFTIMSADFDLDNEPDFCMQWQFRSGTNREIIQPIRFDFLPVVELGIAIRHNNLLNTIGVFVPQGHFEITETAFMHTTQFEYDASITRMETQSPLILNGGHFEQIVLRYGDKNRTSYILMGGHFRMKRFTPGYHAQPTGNPTRHCAVNAIGGEYPEFYLSGIYRPDLSANTDNPHCYTNGGRFGIMAGAGYEQVEGDVTFKIDHSIIDEFYGGGINGSKPVTGSIDVTIDNSLVTKYCGGPKVGVMSSGKTVTTKATGSTFGVFYGGGNGGTNNYREQQKDGTESFPSAEASKWDGFSALNPINLLTGTKVYDDGTDKKGYHAEYEFEIFKSSNGISTNEDVKRAYYRWAQFGTTTTGNVSNTLTDCTVTGNFYGGGNLANVTGDVESLLNGNTHVYGSVFGAGFSASVPSFRVHDKSTVKFPEQDFTGTITEKGTIDYVKNDDGTDRYFTWSNEKPTGVSTDSPTFEKDGKWYCYTTVSLENLGTVTGDVSLTIDGNSIVDHNVFGGGDASETDGSTTVTLKGNTEVRGNVFGGGNNGLVSGSATVNIEE